MTRLDLERLPRTMRTQSMDVLSSQAAIAGYAAVLEGARALDILLPMLTTAAGGIMPAKMIALGAGVAGLQAIATARRLGAIAHGFDVREAGREQVESLGARFVFPNVELVPAEAAGRPPTGKRPGEGEVIATSRSSGPIVRYQSHTPGADAEGDIDALSPWAGQSVGLVSRLQSAGDIVREIADQARLILRRLAS